MLQNPCKSAHKVTVRDDYTGDIIGDINKRRGRIMGMNPIGGGITEVEAEVPMSEMSKYAIDLRALTNGRGEFSFDFVRYEDAPNDVKEKVMAEAKANQE